MPRLPSIRFFHREADAAGAALTTEAGWGGADRGWRKELRWVCILLIVWVTCDLTLGASITSLLTCLRFGWGDWVAGRGGCKMSVYSTPRKPVEHARRIRRAVDKCAH